MKSCSLARSYISPTLSLREDGTTDLIHLCLQMKVDVKKSTDWLRNNILYQPRIQGNFLYASDWRKIGAEFQHYI